jgi:hypothetical protein
MTAQIVVAPCTRTGAAVPRTLGRFALAAIGASLGVISVSSFGADLATGSPQSINDPPQIARTDGRPTPAQAEAPPDTKLDYFSAQRSRMVDQLYQELMRWRPPCASASTGAAMADRC